MKSIQVWTAALLIGAASSWPASAALADTVLYEDPGFIKGKQSLVQSLDITAPGTLTVSLENVPWLDTIQGLQFFLSSSTAVIGGEQNAGVDSYKVGPGTFFVHWSGDAEGAYKMGVYKLEVLYKPDALPVPLPPALPLLLSGLGVVWAIRRRRRPVLVASAP